MIQRLYDILFQFKEYAVLSLFIAVSLVLLAVNDNPQVKRLRSMATVSFGLIQQQVIFIPNYFSLERENMMLRRTNIELADEANQLREAKLENLRLRQVLGLKERLPYDIVSGKIIGKNLTLLRNTLTLNVGEADGVMLHMPVVGDGGLVGLIVFASQHYSIVNVLPNIDFRASAKIQRSRVDGIIAWDGKNLVLKNIAKTLDVKSGDVVITSPYSSTYPPDIRIGVVSDIKGQAGTLFKSVYVTPSVDFVKLEEVFVLTSTPDEERIETEKRSTQKATR